MDEERRNAIKTALQQYRTTVSEHNFTILRIIIDFINQQAVPENSSQERINRIRLRELEEKHLGSIPKSITSTKELLSDEKRAEVIEHCDLDGVENGPVDIDQRSEYFTRVKANMPADNLITGIGDLEFPPPDLEYLCTLVQAIPGPGLPLFRSRNQIEFISSIYEHGLENMAKCVFVPGRDSHLTGLWEEWTIAVGVQIGAGPEDSEWAGSFVIYCRHGDESKGWKWRYGMHENEWHSDLHDSVEEFLGFYARHNKQTEEEVREWLERIPKSRVLGVTPLPAGMRIG